MDGGQWFWLDNQGLGRNMTRKLVTRKFGEGVCGIDISERAKAMKIF
jgi:hypothetical protein